MRPIYEKPYRPKSISNLIANLSSPCPFHSHIKSAVVAGAPIFAIRQHVSLWKKSKGLPDKAVAGHVCLGTKCDYHQIDDVFICQETGNVHVCDDNCKEVIFCRESGNMVCTISGLCSESLLVQDDSDSDEEEAEQEAEVLTGRDRFGRAFEFGYNCESEQELDRSFGFC